MGDRLGLEYVQPLVSLTKDEQKQSQGTDRIANVRLATRKNAPDLAGRTVIIIDDIVTTGASMGGVAKLIRRLGARTVVGAALSVAYKDEYTPRLTVYYN